MDLNKEVVEVEESDTAFYMQDIEFTPLVQEDETKLEDDLDKPTKVENISTKSKSKDTGPTRARNLDGLRGFGTFLVFLYHMGYSDNAWLCISIFFSLSGFIITSITVEAYERRGYVDVLKFWAKRISRLFPALLLLIIILVTSQKFRRNDEITFIREKDDLLFATFFLTNYNLIYNNKDDYFDNFAQPSITRHMWTLSIEEQYYIIWPLIILFFNQDIWKKTKR